jgi:hypothetical protein
MVASVYCVVIRCPECGAETRQFGRSDVRFAVACARCGNTDTAYLSSVDRKLREDGFMLPLLDMRNEYDQIGVLLVSTVMKKISSVIK